MTISHKSDPACEILKSRQEPLDVFFHPQHVAVIGATEHPGSVGRVLLENLIRQPFGGTVYPVNPKRSNVLGVKAYSTISDIPEPIDLAVIMTPAPTVPGLVRECAARGVKGAIVISAGFKEIGPAGAALEQEILKVKGDMRIIGPNCLGVMSPPFGFNATFAAGIAKPGSVGFISQSGALLTAILDWSLEEHVGFSTFLSMGSMLDVNWGDMIEYLGDDPQTKSILLYMESIGDAKSFLSAAREVALTKPIIVLKAGRTASAAHAAASHTGALAGSDEVLDAAFRRCGVLRVNRIAELFDMAEVLAKQPSPRGNRLSVVTNAGGPGVLATDALIQGGGALAPISADTVAQLNVFLPAAWSHSNPIDILGDAGPDRYAKTLEVVAKDSQTDGLLIVLTPQAMTDATATAELLKTYSGTLDRPLLASWMGKKNVSQGDALLAAAGIPTFSYPDTAANAFNYMWKYKSNLNALYETPQLPQRTGNGGRDPLAASQLIDRTLENGRTLLTELESKQLLASYDIPTVPTFAAKTQTDAVRFAEKVGYPAVLKLLSETITHKTDVGGVALNLQNSQQVKDAFKKISGIKGFGGVTVQPMISRDGYELILGCSQDSQFGPVLLFGTGGQLVEVFKDKALGLPPLTTVLARRLMEQTKIFTALGGVRGRKSVNFTELESILVRFSQLVVENPRIKEIDINPLMVSTESIVALDARVLLHPASVKPTDLPRPVIRPYPAQYKSQWKLPDGSKITLRPIRPEDEPLVAQFHETLSEDSVFKRYLRRISLSERVAHSRLVRVCFSDYDRTLALVAETKNADGTRRILAIGRLEKSFGKSEAELSILVSDAVHRIGLGTHIVLRLLEIAQQEHLRVIRAEILPENTGMKKICENLGFQVTLHPEHKVLLAEIHLPT